MRIHSISLAGFRPFKEPIHLQELNSVNIIIGANNIGKSAILLALRRFGQKNFKDNAGRQPPPHPFLPHDKHDNTPSAEESNIELRIELSLTDSEHEKTVVGGISVKPIGKMPERFLISIKDDYADAKLLGNTSGYHSAPVEVARRIIQDFGKELLYIPPLRVVGYKFEAQDMRSLGERTDSGNNLLSDFLSWFLPSADTGEPQPEKVLRFSHLTSSMLGVDSVQAWPTPDQRIRVKINGERPRDLDQMGSGISQIFAIASAIVSHKSPIILLEEPEIGLHPRQQRQLMAELARLSLGQIFVTSHSNHIIDIAGDNVNSYLLRESRNAGSPSRVVEKIGAPSRTVLEELGIRPSSVTLANALICVEGPSDAIYVRHWISLHEIGRGLREYLDFAFIFTGGKTLSHFSTLDDSKAIVRLLNLHPGFYLIGDSDRNNRDSGIKNVALRRLSEESSLIQRFWITQPKEIEGYIEADAICAAFGTKNDRAEDDIYLPLAERLRKLGVDKSYTKVNLAKRVAARPVTLDRFDLRERMAELVAFILKCSDVSTTADG